MNIHLRSPHISRQAAIAVVILIAAIMALMASKSVGRSPAVNEPTTGQNFAELPASLSSLKSDTTISPSTDSRLQSTQIENTDYERYTVNGHVEAF